MVMTMRRKIAAGLGGLTLMLGTLGGAVAVGAANNHPATPAPAVQSGQPDGETADGPDATNGQDAQGTSGAQDLPEAGGTPDAQGASGAQDMPEAGDTPDATSTATGTTTGEGADNAQPGSAPEVEDGGSDAPVTTGL